MTICQLALLFVVFFFLARTIFRESSMKMDVKTNMQHFPVVYLTNRFHVAVGLFSSRSRKTSKVKTSVTHFVCGSRATYFVFTTFLCHLWSITEHDARQHGIYLLIRPWEIVVYGWLLITRTLANSNLALTRTKVDFPGFPSYIYYNFTLYNSTLPLTRTNVGFPSADFYTILPSITRTML